MPIDCVAVSGPSQEPSSDSSATSPDTHHPATPPPPLSPPPPSTDKDKLLGSVAGIIVKEHLQKRKREIVEKYMAIVTEWLEPKLAAFEAIQDADDDGGGDGSCGSSHQHGPDHPARRRRPGRAAAGRVSISGQKRQLADDDDDPDEDGPDEDDGDPGRNNSKRTKMTMTQLELVCPYYQRDPKRFGNVATCRGHSWPSIPRLKEHLQRSHQRPRFQCNRCRMLFVEPAELEKHQRQETPCKLARERSTCLDALDGYNPGQAEQLKKRFVGKSVEEKWREIYCILFFVDKDKEKIPSPYFSPLEHSADRPFDTRKECVQLIREHFIPALQRQLEALVDREISGAIGKKINSAIPTIINKEFNGVVRTWMEITPPAAPPLPPEEDAGGEEDGESHGREVDYTTSDMLTYLEIDALLAQFPLDPMFSFGPLGCDADADPAGLGPAMAASAASESEISDLFSVSLQDSSVSVDGSVRQVTPDCVVAPVTGGAGGSNRGADPTDPTASPSAQG